MMTMNMYGCPPPDWGPGACVGSGALPLGGPHLGVGHSADRHEGYADVPAHGYLGANPAYYPHQYYPEYAQQQPQPQHQAVGAVGAVGVITTDDGLSYTNLDYGPYGPPPGPAGPAAPPQPPQAQHLDVGATHSPTGPLKVEQPQHMFGSSQEELYDPLGHVNHHHHHHPHVHHSHNHHREDFGAAVSRADAQYLAQRPQGSPQPQFKEEYPGHQPLGADGHHPQPQPQPPGGSPQGQGVQGVLGGEAPYSHLHLTPHHHHLHHHPHQHHHVHHQLQHSQQQQQQGQQMQQAQQQHQQQPQQSAPQQAAPVPTYKWMQVKRNVPKPAGEDRVEGALRPPPRLARASPGPGLIHQPISGHRRGATPPHRD